MFHYNIDYNFVKKYASKITRSHLENLVEKEDELKDKILEAAKINAAFMVKFGPKIILIFQMLKDYLRGEYKEITDPTLNSSAFAVMYFLNPFDLIPDFLPIIGYLDDILILNIVWENVQKELIKYAAWKKSDLINDLSI